MDHAKHGPGLGMIITFQKNIQPINALHLQTTETYCKPPFLKKVQ